MKRIPCFVNANLQNKGSGVGVVPSIFPLFFPALNRINLSFKIKGCSRTGDNSHFHNCLILLKKLDKNQLPMYIFFFFIFKELGVIFKGNNNFYRRDCYEYERGERSRKKNGDPVRKNEKDRPCQVDPGCRGQQPMLPDRAFLLRPGKLLLAVRLHVVFPEQNRHTLLKMSCPCRRKTLRSSDYQSRVAPQGIPAFFMPDEILQNIGII